MDKENEPEDPALDVERPDGTTPRDNIFNKADVRVALACVGETRRGCGMIGVLVEPGRLVATDGNRLVVVEQPDAPACKHDETRKPVDGRSLADAIKGAKVASVNVNGALEARDIHGRTLATLPREDEDGDFPDFRAVMPKAKDMEGAVTVRLSARLLGGIMAALAQTVDSGYATEPGVDIEIPKPDEKGSVLKPLRMTATLKGGSTATVILMPMTK